MTDDRLLAAKAKFSRLLKEIFQFDCADLDFGIYRILGMRRAELERFLDDELLPQVEGILATAAGDRASVQSELSKLEQTLRDAGIQDFSSSPKWNELKAKLAASPDVAVLAREVFSDLTTFFARYYDEGDFMALPRYKGDTYAIPYDGSEVKLHWANADQYYVKTTEQHADYTAVLEGVAGLEKPRLRFRLAAAESDRDNNKSAEKRRYVLRAADPLEVGEGELTVWFEYRVPEPGAGRQPTQSALCEQAEKEILANANVPFAWQATLRQRAPQNPDKYTVLGYQLYRYTKKNTSDYFIHKDLGGFLRRELDFFIKNEVLFLDDIEGRTSAEIDAALQKVKAIRAVGGKIIDWLAQIEDFQKRLFLKKKFVLRTRWLVTLDKCPSKLRERLVSNSAQRAQWTGECGGSPLHDKSEELLRGWVVDSDLHPSPFREQLRSAADFVRHGAHSILIKGDNFHALRMLRPTFDHSVALAYIDPPYNTGENEFLYRDGYRHSSWMCLVRDRIALSLSLLSRDGNLMVSCDDAEVHRLRLALETSGPQPPFLANLVWKSRQNVDSREKNNLSNDHEFILAYGAPVRGADKQMSKYTNPDFDPRGPWMSDNMVGLATRQQRPNLHYNMAIARLVECCSRGGDLDRAEIVMRTTCGTFVVQRACVVGPVDIGAQIFLALPLNGSGEQANIMNNALAASSVPTPLDKREVLEGIYACPRAATGLKYPTTQPFFDGDGRPLESSPGSEWWRHGEGQTGSCARRDSVRGSPVSDQCEPACARP